MYRVRKSVRQYTLVDLLEVLRNENHLEYQQVNEEYQKRNPEEKELEIARKELKIRLKSRNKTLSFVDKVSCFFIPFVSTKSPYVADVVEINEAFEKQMEEFEIHGETRRMEELKKWQKYARITHLTIISLIFLAGISSVVIKFFLKLFH